MVSGVGDGEDNEPEVSFAELPAPEGWKKKLQLTPKKNVKSKENEIVYIAPTGEEIFSRKQLLQYLKSHPVSPPLHEFDWSKSAEKPRRSARISEKAKAVSPAGPEPEPKKKRSWGSSSKRTKGGANVGDTPQDEQEQKDGAKLEECAENKFKNTEDVHELKNTEDVHELKKTEDAPPIASEVETKNIPDEATAVQETEEIFYDAISDEDTSNAKQHDHQPVINSFKNESLNVSENIESKSSDETNEKQNFKQPGRIEAQQHLAPTLRC